MAQLIGNRVRSPPFNEISRPRRPYYARGTVHFQFSSFDHLANSRRLCHATARLYRKVSSVIISRRRSWRNGSRKRRMRENNVVRRWLRNFHFGDAYLAGGGTG